MTSLYGLEIGGDIEHLYRQPKAEQVAVLALKQGPWRDEEMVKGLPPMSGELPSFFKFEDGEAASRASRILSRG